MACSWTRRACQRQQDDIALAEAGRFPYRFDVAAANRVVEFIEQLPHVKGRQFIGKRLTLGLWQCFILTTVFGWLREDGSRRFRTVYIEVPRKNGKSSMTAGVGLYMLVADGELGAEVYSAATNRDQAKIVWADARQMVLQTPDVRSALGVDVSAHSIFVQRTNSYFKPLSRDQRGNLDGLNVHAALVDELHGHKDRGIWDVLETATGSRFSPLVWAITTAGVNQTGICMEQRKYVQKVLMHAHHDETYFGIIYCRDAADDPFARTTWRKANPNYGVSVSVSDLERKANKARSTPSALSNFLTKHLCEWVNADNPWMNLAAWDKCADPHLTLESMEGVPCVMACDLAVRTDIAARITLFYATLEGVRHYYVFGRYYLPEAATHDGRNPHYYGWSQGGRLVLSPGETIDFNTVEADIEADAKRLQVVDCVFDPWQAQYLIQRLADHRVPTAEYRQTVQNMSPPMKELEAAVLEGRIHHAGDPVLRWMIGNVVCHIDAKDNIYPRKEYRENKIDGAVALIMAFGAAGLHAEVEKRPLQMFMLG